MRHYQRHAFSLITAAIFLLGWFQCGEPAWAEKQKYFQDVSLNISANPGYEASELFLEMGLPPGHCKIALLEPGLWLGNTFQDLISPYLHCKGIKSRAPPVHFPT